MKIKAGIHEAQGHRQTMEDKHTVVASVKEKYSNLLPEDSQDISFVALFDGNPWIIFCTDFS